MYWKVIVEKCSEKELIGMELEYKIQRKAVICCTNEKIT